MIAAVILTLTAIAANVGDIWTTQRGLALGAKESNPVAKWIFAKLGVRAAWLLKAVMAGALAYVWLNWSTLVYCIAAGAMTASGAYATWHNYGVIQKRLAKRAAAE